MSEQPNALRLAQALNNRQEVEDDAAAELRRLHDENKNMKARLDRAIKAAETHFGEDAIRYKFSLMKNGRTRNVFPAEFDGRWFALQRSDNDAHIGLCDQIVRLHEAREQDRRAMREALEAMDTVQMVWGKGLYSTLDDALTHLRQRLEQP